MTPNSMEPSKEQKEIIESSEKFIQVIAAAGSGKTFTMIRLAEKIFHSKQFKESEILLITFSRKAAEELRERLEKAIGSSSIRIHTFHAFCLKMINSFHPDLKQKIQILTPEEKEEILKEFYKSKRDLIGGIPYELLQSKTNLLSETYFPGLSGEAEMYYRDFKRENHRLDFDDLVSVFLDGLKKNEAWSLKAKQEIRLIIVDEFQDTDPVQLEWLQLMGPEKLIVVGDDWQAIYGFRGASTEPFLNFNKIFTPCKRYFLTANHRSVSEIVQISAFPIHKNKKNIPKTVVASRKEKGNVLCTRIKELRDWQSLILEVQSRDAVILCRTNYRIRTLIKIGFPADKIFTIHASKGLEYSTVYLDLYGGWTSEEESDPEEERRILYVGLSRARDNLFILGPPELSSGREQEFYKYFIKKYKDLEFPTFLNESKKN